MYYITDFNFITITSILYISLINFFTDTEISFHYTLLSVQPVLPKYDDEFTKSYRVTQKCWQMYNPL